eukprot:9200178-Alexandrium_andersonii.AAC.1
MAAAGHRPAPNARKQTSCCVNPNTTSRKANGLRATAAVLNAAEACAPGADRRSTWVGDYSGGNIGDYSGGNMCDNSGGNHIPLHPPCSSRMCLPAETMQLACSQEPQ